MSENKSAENKTSVKQAPDKQPVASLSSGHPTAAEDAIQPQETLIEFPCDFPIKVMGESQEGFSTLIVQLIRTQVPEFDGSKMDQRASSGGRYTSLTCTVYVTTKRQLDGVYRALTAHPDVKFVL